MRFSHFLTLEIDLPNVWHMVVSWNGGTPTWMVYHGKSNQPGWFRGTPVSGNHHSIKFQHVRWGRLPVFIIHQEDAKIDEPYQVIACLKTISHILNTDIHMYIDIWAHTCNNIYIYIFAKYDYTYRYPGILAISHISTNDSYKPQNIYSHSLMFLWSKSSRREFPKKITARELVKNPEAWGPGSIKFLFLNTGKFTLQQAEGPLNSYGILSFCLQYTMQIKMILDLDIFIYTYIHM